MEGTESPVKKKTDYAYLLEILELVLSKPFLQTRSAPELKEIIKKARENGQSEPNSFSEQEVISTVEAYLEMAQIFLCQQRYDKLSKMLEIVAKSLLLFHTTESYPRTIHVKYNLLKALSEKSYDSTRLAVCKELLTKAQGSVDCESLTCLLHMLVCLLHVKVHGEVNYSDTKSATLYFTKRLRLGDKMPPSFQGLDLAYLNKRLKLAYEPYQAFVCLAVAVAFHLECLLQTQAGIVRPEAKDLANKCLFYVGNLDYQYQVLLRLPTENLRMIISNNDVGKLTSKNLEEERKKYQVTLNNFQPKVTFKNKTNSHLNVPDSIVNGNISVKVNDMGPTRKIGTLIILNNDQPSKNIQVKKRSQSELKGSFEGTEINKSKIPDSLAHVVVSPNMQKKQIKDQRIKAIRSQHISVNNFGNSYWKVSAKSKKNSKSSSGTDALKEKNDTSKDEKLHESMNDSIKQPKHSHAHHSKTNHVRSVSNFDDLDILNMITEEPKNRFLQRKPSNESLGRRQSSPYASSAGTNQNSLKNILQRQQTLNHTMLLEPLMQEQPSIEEQGSIQKISLRKIGNEQPGNGNKELVIKKVPNEKSIANLEFEARDMNYFFGNIVTRRPSFVLSSRPSPNSTRATWLQNTDRKVPNGMQAYLNNPFGLDEPGNHKRKVENFERKRRIRDLSTKRAKINLERWGWSKEKWVAKEVKGKAIVVEKNHTGFNQADDTDQDTVIKRNRDLDVKEEYSIYEGDMIPGNEERIATLEDDEIEELKGLFSQVEKRTVDDLQTKQNPARSKRLLLKALQVIQGAHSLKQQSPKNKLVGDQTPSLMSPTNLEATVLHAKTSQQSSGTEGQIYGRISVGSRGNKISRELDVKEGSVRRHSMLNESVLKKGRAGTIKKAGLKEGENSIRSAKLNNSTTKGGPAVISRFGKKVVDKDSTPKDMLNYSQLNDDDHTSSDGSKSGRRNQSRELNNSRRLNDTRHSGVNKRGDRSFLDDIHQQIRQRESKMQQLTSKTAPQFDEKWCHLVRNRLAKCFALLRLATTTPNAV
jgi:hypothetical protein